MRFAHISDLHLCSDTKAGGAANEHALAIARSIANDLARIAGVLDFIVVSGDLTDDTRSNSFLKFEHLFSPLAPPVFVIPGNHDGPSAYFREAENGFLAKCDISGRVVDLGTVRLVGLNTCVENETAGALSQEELDLVAREIAEGNAAQLIIVMHHPPFPPGLREFDEIAHLEGSAGLAQVLQGAVAPPIILCGHVHRVYQARWHGAACFVAGSPALPFTSELPFGDTPIYPANQEVCYFVHSIDGAETHVVTPQYVLGGRTSL